MNALKKWLAAATPAQQRLLAKRAGTTFAVLRQTAGAYRTNGKLTLTPDFAKRLELASRGIPVVPALNREELCPACGRCEFAKQCRG